MFVKKIMSPDLSGSIRSYIEEVTRDVGETLELTKRPKECLFYFMDGRGVMSIYDPILGGDVYEIRRIQRSGLPLR